MPLRTTTVVASGLVVLGIVGVATIFGESLAALVTPPPSTEPTAAHATTTAGAATSLPSQAAGPGPNPGDGGTTRTTADGSS